MNRLRAVGVAFIAAVLPAVAGANPPLLPTRDVAVLYNVSVPGRADASYQLEYEAADQRARITGPANGMYFLVDLPAGSAQLIIPMLHSMVAAPDFSELTRQINDADHARFTLLGNHVYAGLACQTYLILGRQGSGTACIMPDGVVLHFSGKNANGSAELTATSVSHEPMPPGDFTPPSGFSTVTLPPGMLAQLLAQQ